MNRLFTGIVVFSIVLLGSGFTSNAQVVVKVKPHKAKVHYAKPIKAKPHHTWVNSHWRWNKSTHAYVWVRGRYIKNRRGHSYTQGYWISNPRRGHVWKPGHWRRT